ncbi:MAG: ion transporter [Paludibacteraceae bacterium]|nr:ion transporter [Paludibacteraceae bacterium]
MRNRIYEIISPNGHTVYSKIYDWFMLVCILLSIGPLAFRTEYPLFDIFDKIAVTVFIIDYILRWITADFELSTKKRWQAFALYPLTPFAIIDLLSILPSFAVGQKALKLFRIARLVKILRVFKFIRYSKQMQILIKVLRKEKQILFTVFLIAVFYIFITALIMFNVEESAMFDDFFDALYWATTTLTTVGYGDIYPSSDIGRIISMISALLGVAVIALPSGVITASYLEELREQKKKDTTNEKN